MQIKKIEKFFNKQIKLLIKNRKILLGVLLVALLIIFNPMVEGLESDSFWCKYFSWFPGVSCEDKPKEEEEEDDFFKDDEESTQEEDESSPEPSTTPAPKSEPSTSPKSEPSTAPEPELPDCTCNANCQLRNKSEDRILNKECKIPEGIEGVSTLTGYCDKCYDIVNTGCRLHTSETPKNDPVIRADNWCGGTKVEGEGVIERCKATDTNNLVPEGAWKGMAFEEAYPKVLVNYIVDSTDFSGEGGKCENNMNPKLKWTKYPYPN